MAKSCRKITKRGLSPLSALPRELRDLIYAYAITYPNLNHVYKKLELQEAKCEEEHQSLHIKQPKCRVPRPTVSLQTPGILLVNKQMHAEALDYLRNTALPLVIPGPPPVCYATGRGFVITELVGEETLQALKGIVLEIDFLY